MVSWRELLDVEVRGENGAASDSKSAVTTAVVPAVPLVSLSAASSLLLRIFDGCGCSVFEIADVTVLSTFSTVVVVADMPSSLTSSGAWEELMSFGNVIVVCSGDFEEGSQPIDVPFVHPAKKHIDEGRFFTHFCAELLAKAQPDGEVLCSSLKTLSSMFRLRNAGALKVGVLFKVPSAMCIFQCVCGIGVGDDGRRVGAVLKKCVKHSKIKLFKDFRGLLINRHGLSRAARDLVANFQIGTAANGMLLSFNDNDVFESAVPRLFSDDTVTKRVSCFKFEVTAPLQSFVICELLRLEGEQDPTYGLQIQSLTLQGETHIAKPTPPPAEQRADMPSSVQVTRLEAKNEDEKNVVTPRTSRYSVSLDELVVQMRELRGENAALKEMLLEEQRSRKSEMGRLAVALDEIRAKAADHALVERALGDLRSEIPSHEAIQSLADEAFSRNATTGDRAADAKLSELHAALQQQRQEFAHALERHAVSVRQLRQGTGIAVDKLHAQLLQLDQMCSGATQSLSQQLHMVTSQVKNATVTTEGKLSQQLIEFERAHQLTQQQVTTVQQQCSRLSSAVSAIQASSQATAAAGSSSVHDLKTTITCSNEELKAAVHQQLVSIGTRLGEFDLRVKRIESTVATELNQQHPVASSTQIPAQRSPSDVAGVTNSGQYGPVAIDDLQLLNAKLARANSDLKVIDTRVHKLELLQAEVASLLESSATQAERFHTLDDKVDDLQIKVETVQALSNK